MDHRIGGVDQAIVIIPRQTELSPRQVSAKDSDPRLQIFVEPWEVQMQLQRMPQAHLRLVRISRPYQHVQRSSVLLQQIGGDVPADVSSGPGQEYRHVAPFVPVLMVSPLLSASAS